MSIVDGKTILITGGTGSFGKACVKKLLDEHKPRRIRIFSRDELKQWDMHRQFGDHPSLRFLIGDVRDAERVKRATEEPLPGLQPERDARTPTFYPVTLSAR